MPYKTITGSEVRCVLTWDAFVGESPLWHIQEKRLYWVDITNQRVMRFDPQTGSNEVFSLPDLVTCLAFRRAGGLILSMRKQIAMFDPEAGKFEPIASVEDELPDNRFNDGRVDPQGRFWAGTMSNTHWNAPLGNLYRMDADHRVRKMRSEVICSNGTDWSPDGRTMYHTESFRYAVFAYDFDPATGDIGNRRVFCQLDKNPKVFPDGLTVDAEGFVWSNHVGVGQIVRYDAEGKIERIVQLPVPRATGCTFGGDDLQTLYVTSARETMTSEQLAAAPLSGSVFAVDTGIRGKPAAAFAG